MVIQCFLDFASCRWCKIKKSTNLYTSPYDNRYVLFSHVSKMYLCTNLMCWYTVITWTVVRIYQALQRIWHHKILHKKQVLVSIYSPSSNIWIIYEDGWFFPWATVPFHSNKIKLTAYCRLWTTCMRNIIWKEWKHMRQDRVGTGSICKIKTNH